MMSITPSHHFHRLFDPSALSAPRDFVPMVLPDCPIALEIGAGKGRHAMLYAQHHPHHHIIAIERTSEKFLAFAKACQAHKLANLTAVHADAIAWTVHAIAPQSLDTVFILYPNPEPKNKNQRFIHMPFFEFLLSRLKADGQIIVASNIMAYLDEMAEHLTAVWQLPFVRRTIDKTSARTHFEIKYLSRGERCDEIVITKPSDYRTRFDQTRFDEWTHD